MLTVTDSFKREIKILRLLTDELLLDQLYRFEGIMGKYNCQHQKYQTKCNFQKAFHRLIRKEIDIIKLRLLTIGF
jgi:hypothetical protein